MKKKAIDVSKLISSRELDSIFVTIVSDTWMKSINVSFSERRYKKDYESYVKTVEKYLRDLLEGYTREDIAGTIAKFYNKRTNEKIIIEVSFK